MCVAHVQVNCINIYCRREKMWRDCYLGPGMSAPQLASEVAGDLGPNPAAQPGAAGGQVAIYSTVPSRSAPTPNPGPAVRFSLM